MKNSDRRIIASCWHLLFHNTHTAKKQLFVAGQLAHKKVLYRSTVACVGADNVAVTSATTDQALRNKLVPRNSVARVDIKLPTVELESAG